MVHLVVEAVGLGCWVVDGARLRGMLFVEMRSVEMCGFAGFGFDGDAEGPYVGGGCCDLTHGLPYIHLLVTAVHLVK